MNDAVARPAHARPRWLKPVLIVALLAALAAFLWQALPGAAYPTDLKRIGVGRPTLVLAHDANFVGSATVMELMNVIRADYEGRVDFLVAHLALDEAQVFAARHGASDGTVLLFSGDGQRVGLLRHPQTIEELRGALDRAFGG